MARREGDLPGGRQVSASSRSFASPSNTSAPVTAPLLRRTFFPRSLAARREEWFSGHSRHHVNRLIKTNQHRMRLIMRSSACWLAAAILSASGESQCCPAPAPPAYCPAPAASSQLSHFYMLLFQVIAKHGDADLITFNGWLNSDWLIRLPPL